MERLRQEAETSVCSLARDGVDGALNVLAPIQLLVQTHQDETKYGRANSG